MLKTDLCGVTLKTPVMPASGTFGNGREFVDYLDLNELGALVTTGITYDPRAGNSGIRIHETASGLMNSIGLQNPSIETFLKDDYPFMKEFDSEIIANIGGATVEEYAKGIEMINDTDIKIIELNISCPNVKEGGMAFGIKCDTAQAIVSEMRKLTDKVLMVKLSPNCDNIQEMAITCQKAGADALSLVNTFNGLAIDIHKRRAVFDNITAGLSGPAIKPIALAMVRSVHQVVDLPIVGIGGIVNYQDAIEFIMAGATAIQVGSANFANPCVMAEITEGLKAFMEAEGIKDLAEIRGIVGE